jgi:hypothetical protein
VLFIGEKNLMYYRLPLGYGMGKDSGCLVIHDGCLQLQTRSNSQVHRRRLSELRTLEPEHHLRRCDVPVSCNHDDDIAKNGTGAFVLRFMLQCYSRPGSFRDSTTTICPKCMLHTVDGLPRYAHDYLTNLPCPFSRCFVLALARGQ